MPRKSDALLLLEAMTNDQLRDFAQWRGLKKSGSKKQLARRIAADSQRDLTQLVSPDGSPWNRDDWNRFVERVFGGSRRRAWGDVRGEIARRVRVPKDERFIDPADIVDPVVELRKLIDADDLSLIGTFESFVSVINVAEMRRSARFLDILAQGVGTSGANLRDFFHGLNGNYQLGNLWEELRRAFPGSRRSAEPAPASPRAPTPEPSSRFDSSEASWTKADSLDQPAIGDLLANRFQIERLLGEGGFGLVYKVIDTSSPGITPLVAKLPLSNAARESLVREARHAMRLSHPNICRYFLPDDDHRFGKFLLMEYAGESLAARFRDSGAHLDTALDLFTQAATGLDYLHDNQVGHGDVSPMNILVDEQGRVRVTDFGISSHLKTKTLTHGLTRVATVLGYNEAFAPPELRALGARRRLHRASDQYMLAVSLCAVLQGVGDFFDTPRFHFQRFSASQQQVVDRALRNDPGRRFSSCSEFMAAL